MNGVVHVGAHRGEELSGYLNDGMNPVILFEPQPLMVSLPKGVTMVRVALGDVDGSLTMMIPHHLHTAQTRDTMSASGLPLNHDVARSIGWTPTKCDILKVPILRFDSWAERSGFRGGCDLLVVDVQGMELQVLKGFGEWLRSFVRVKVECSETPVYVGGARAADVIEYLAEFDFAQLTAVKPHDDIFFAKERPV